MDQRIEISGTLRSIGGGGFHRVLKQPVEGAFSEEALQLARHMFSVTTLGVYKNPLLSFSGESNLDKRREKNCLNIFFAGTGEIGKFTTRTSVVKPPEFGALDLLFVHLTFYSLKKSLLELYGNTRLWRSSSSFGRTI